MKGSFTEPESNLHSNKTVKEADLAAMWFYPDLLELGEERLKQKH
jgi:hypothetical protein